MENKNIAHFIFETSYMFQDQFEKAKTELETAQINLNMARVNFDIACKQLWKSTYFMQKYHSNMCDNWFDELDVNENLFNEAEAFIDEN